jgi:hypothetical protein
MGLAAKNATPTRNRIERKLKGQAIKLWNFEVRFIIPGFISVLSLVEFGVEVGVGLEVEPETACAVSTGFMVCLR